MNYSSTVRQIYQGRMLEYDLKECETSYVSEKLCQEMEHWTSQQPILINASTGSGKSRFVLYDLADYAEKHGRWILVLSNRIALNLQQKMDLCRKRNLPIVGTKILADCQEFGNVVLCTYQSSRELVNTLLQQYNWYQQNLYKGELSITIPPYPYSPPQFVVFDEAHFFCSDAVFNPQAEAILEQILTSFPYAIRIYMSATPTDVKPVIAEKEYGLLERMLMTNPSMKLYQLAGKFRIIEYYFKADYDHVNLNFFYEWKSIEKRILDEKDSAYKWLIFINSKDIGKQIRKNLTKQLASYIDAESNKPKLQALTRTQFFEKKVLISTSVIDNGISIYDDKLKNIVVDFSDKVQLMQMIGRKRCQKKEPINIYVRIPSPSEIGLHKRNAERLINELHMFEKSPWDFFKWHWGKMDERTQKLFAAYPMGLGINFGSSSLTEYQLSLTCGQLEQLGDKLLQNKYAYAEQVCEWLQKAFDPTMCLDESIEDDALKILNDFLIKNTENEISTAKNENKISEMDELSEQIIGFLSTSQRISCGIRTGKSRSKRNIEKILEHFKLPYVLSKLGTKKYCIQRKPE